MFCVDLVRTLAGAIIIAYVCLGSVLPVLFSESVICLLTFKSFDCACFFGFVVGVALFWTCVGAIISKHVNSILFLRFMLSRFVMNSETFK